MDEMLSKEEIAALFEVMNDETPKSNVQFDNADSDSHILTSHEMAIDCLQRSGWLEKHDKEISEADYQRGLDDAWDLAEKISCMKPDTLHDIFKDQYYDHCREAFIAHTYKETKQAVADYEEQKRIKQDIKVGDEVLITDNENELAVVIRKELDYSDDLLYTLINSTGERKRKVNDIIKTGRYFPQIAEVLKAMQEGE